MKRIIPVILAMLILTGLPCFGSGTALAETELVGRRTENSRTWKTGRRTYRLEVGNHDHYRDSSGKWQSVTLRLSDAVEVQTDVWRLSAGRFGYTADLANGCVRAHPREDGDIVWSKWMQVCGSMPVSLSYTQHSERLLELYVDNSTIRYSYFISPDGFRTQVKLKSGYDYNAKNTWSFDVTFGGGLSLSGRKVYDGATFLGSWPAPTYCEGDSITCGDATETYTNDVLTWEIPVATLEGVGTWPVTIR